MLSNEIQLEIGEVYIENKNKIFYIFAPNEGKLLHNAICALPPFWPLCRYYLVIHLVLNIFLFFFCFSLGGGGAGGCVEGWVGC